MSTIEYRYSIDYYNEDGARLGAVSIEPDWQPALTCARFSALRSGISSEDAAPWIEPVWDSELGAPNLSAAQIVVARKSVDGEAKGETGGEFREEIGGRSAFFKSLAKSGSSEMVEKGVLLEGQLYHYQVCAYPTGTAASSEHEGACELDFCEVDETLPLLSQPIERFAGASVYGEPSECDDDMRVFVSRSVMDEVKAASREASDVEVGGFLLGHLHRPPGSSDIYLEVRAQVPARHTDASSASLTFTAESWAAARAAIELRGEGELLCGWWHFHPDFCRRCPEERKRQCLFLRPFFSLTDIHMHRTVFAEAFQIALLASDHGREDLDLSLFGWRRGTVESRAFETFDR